MLSLLLDTGIRRGELAALRLGDLNLGQRLAFIEASTSKSRRGRAVVYGDATAKALMRYLRHPKAPRAEGAPLWIARTGQPLTGNEIFHTIGRRARRRVRRGRAGASGISECDRPARTGALRLGRAEVERAR